MKQSVTHRKRFPPYPRLIIPLLLLSIVVVGGWSAMGYLSDKARQELIKDNESAISILSVHMAVELKRIEGAVDAMSGCPGLLPALITGTDQNIMRANSLLDLNNSAANASVSYLIDRTGMTIASSNRNDPDSFVGRSYHFRPYFIQAMKGSPGRYFASGVTSLKRGFYASFPVRDGTGTIVGVVAMKKELDEIEKLLAGYPLCFFVDPHGIIFLSSKKEMLLKSLAPIDHKTAEALLASRQLGAGPFDAVMPQDVADGMTATLDGTNYLVSRRVIDPEGWSMVIMTSMDRVVTYRSFAIIVTIGTCLLIIIVTAFLLATVRAADKVRESEELYKTLAATSRAGVYIVQDGNFQFINYNAAWYAGYTEDELTGMDALKIVHPEDKKTARDNARRMLRGETTLPYEFRVVTKDGETRWIMETVTSIEYQGKRAVLGNSMDVTELREAGKRLQESSKRLTQIIEGSPVPAFVIDCKHIITHWNRSCENLTGFSARDIIGTRRQWMAFYPEERPTMADFLVDNVPKDVIARNYGDTCRETSVIDGGYESEQFFPALGESGRWLFFTAVPLRDIAGNVTGAIETLQDITERKNMEEEIRGLSVTDQLTGLYNRRGFLMLTEQQLKLSDRTKKGALLFYADLDGMKVINDTFGHEEGDMALVETASLLRQSFRTSDIIARMGGDEFAILAIDTTGKDPGIITARLQDRIDRHNRGKNRKYTLSISVGYSWYDHENPCSLDELMSRADTLMYEQKKGKMKKVL